MGPSSHLTAASHYPPFSYFSHAFLSFLGISQTRKNTQTLLPFIFLSLVSLSFLKSFFSSFSTFCYFQRYYLWKHLISCKLPTPPLSLLPHNSNTHDSAFNLPRFLALSPFFSNLNNYCTSTTASTVSP